ncbi:MAG: hypothetical protein LBD48_12580 [Treponema sp.]|jgi:hypothetical protein|nr:hypothetical protein [Treponema sp.]
MKSRKLLLGMLVLVLAFGMTVVGCDDGSTDGNTDPHKVTITGLAGKTGTVSVLLYSYLDINATGVAAGGQGIISGNSVTVSLQQIGGGWWSGSGPHHILLQLPDETAYVYTNAQTLEQLGITTDEDLFTRIPKYNITGTATTIAFDRFLDVTGF